MNTPSLSRNKSSSRIRPAVKGADSSPQLQELLDTDDFQRRHIGPNNQQVHEMLAVLGVKTLDELISQTIPAAIRTPREFSIGEPVTEHAMLRLLAEWMSANKRQINMLGLGYYGCYTPPVIQRSFLEDPGWYTAYTPYQSEISQGRLELLVNFQQMITELTAMDCANASLLDEATAAAEAMMLAKKVAKNKRNKFFVDKYVFPQTQAVLMTRSAPHDIELVCGDIEKDYMKDPADYFGVLTQYPNMQGRIHSLTHLAHKAHTHDALFIVASDLLALALLNPPGAAGADIVLGNSQRFGVPLGYGGPHAAFFAVKSAYQRHLPGRLIGISKDSKNKPALRMALQTREQHIRRDKATSNICTAQVLLANMAVLYAMYHGIGGLRIIAKRVERLAHLLAYGLERMGEEILHKHFFGTIVIRTHRARQLRQEAEKAGYNLLNPQADLLSVSCDETTQPCDIEAIWRIFNQKTDIDIFALDRQLKDENALSAKFLRQDKILSHLVFNNYGTETKMVRYLRSLRQKDIGLDRSMIALGSCTMKLNAAAEMIPLSWESVNNIHPFAPNHQTKGYQNFFTDFSRMLKEITGLSGISLQPNSGAQGEYAGLMTIRNYHLSRGDGKRTICLIPSSAHGTNPASAVLAGMQVRVVKCDEKGNVDIQDFDAKVEEASGCLAAFMITYPSTHGVFEDSIQYICKKVHEHGGRIYLDGANLNAMVGLVRPADIGVDVCHINLHKTFCIPHGGGGPGMGPIAVAQHLIDFLPGHPVGAVSAAPYGSASILPISWAYIKMMGSQGLIRATKIAILNANYLAQQLAPHYPILYKGKTGRNAHECILDIRPIKKETSVTEEDIAKRLIDYGFHAPTMSFPVIGTLMIEPTESESKEELDRFIAAMISIRAEITRILNGEYPAEDNPLRNAPHTLEDLYGEWRHTYSKEQAFYPLPYLKQDKYFPPVNRVDNVYGDRNLVCGCLPTESYTN